ncbi:unnamed protein product [Cylindrotheca closterium]|uniref:Uncharacterized protein n=1 Tax=Cylindrotheca closterium TaxID=2856 RepID=A0AAD2FL45_9STRA|nr:unnamed protein product [Cylindrotheca closterium]
MSIMNNYRDNLVEKVGGQSQFEYIVIKYCEGIQDDSSVQTFFADMDLNGLIDLQKEFLNAALLDLNQEEAQAAMGRLAMKHQHLWSGLEERHFDVLKAHFIEALRDCWVEEKYVALFDKHYDSLRPLFQQAGGKTNNKDTAERIHIHSSMAQRSVMRNNRLGAGMPGNPRT